MHEGTEGEDEQAEIYWRACLAAGDPKAHFGLGYTLCDLGRPREAYGHLLEYTRILPRNGWAWTWLGQACEGIGETRQAARCYRRAIRLERPTQGPETDAAERLERLRKRGRDRSGAGGDCADAELVHERFVVKGKPDDLRSSSDRVVRQGSTSARGKPFPSGSSSTCPSRRRLHDGGARQETAGRRSGTSGAPSSWGTKWNAMSPRRPRGSLMSGLPDLQVLHGVGRAGAVDGRRRARASDGCAATYGSKCEY